MDFKVGDIVFLKKDSEWLKGESENNPFNVPGIITSTTIKDELSIEVAWKYPKWHDNYILVTSKINTNTYKSDDLELLGDKKLSDYYTDIIELAKKRNWGIYNTISDGTFYTFGDGIQLHLLKLNRVNELYSSNKLNIKTIKYFIREVINFHFQYGSGEINFI